MKCRQDKLLACSKPKCHVRIVYLLTVNLVSKILFLYDTRLLRARQRPIGRCQNLHQQITTQSLLQADTSG